jgi:iron complex outermembrane receptor protein
MRSVIFTVLYLTALSHLALGNDFSNDTLRLGGITVYGQYFDRFGQGSQIQQIDSLGLIRFKSYNLNDILKARAPVHFKSYGSGMLSSISFRGTGAGHTAVLWNGLQVNQPTIGQSDFSLFPVFAFDDIRIHYGAASSRYGSDAIGGGILLQSTPDWNQSKIAGNLDLLAGSYGRYMGLAEIRLHPTENLLLKTKAYRNIHENDFKFENITRPGSPVERQKNASMNQYGILQDLYIRTSPISRLSFHGWFNYSDRQIQPSMTNTNANETQEDKNLRISADYQIASALGYFEVKVGYLWDYMYYNQQSEIITNQFIGQLNYEKEINQWELIAGSNYRHISANSEGYESIQREERINLFGGTVYRGFKNTDLSFNIRQLFVSGLSSPLSPSFGISHTITVNSSMKWILDGQASLNYRIPTLNDRFWEPGGKEDLKPENSKNLEGTVSWQYLSGIDLKFSLSGYHYWVEDWILWTPGPSYWIPDNVRKVQAKGLEFKINLQTVRGLSDFLFNAYYSYSRSLIKESPTENDRSLGKQLPYTPIHLAAADLQWLYKQWHAGVQLDFTGKRFVTTDNESDLPGYMLINLRAGRNFRIHSQTIALDVRIDNVFNKQYQSVLYRAMPGRVFMVKINFLFK